ncbi:MAG TPA: hypothetical protein EYQ79_00255 [Flavobacteriaceae bacterium]|nr:hypothetical protein [Flavobacteriaceae bacterium]
MKLKNLQSLLFVSILGMISILIPVFILDDLRTYDSPLFPMIRTGIEGISLYSLLFLISSGLIIKSFSDLSSWKIGLASMALFPLAAICEIIYEPTSHNLFPLEFIFYAIYSLPALLGAYLSEFITNKLLK